MIGCGWFSWYYVRYEIVNEPNIVYEFAIEHRAMEQVIEARNYYVFLVNVLLLEVPIGWVGYSLLCFSWSPISVYVLYESERYGSHISGILK